MVTNIESQRDGETTWGGSTSPNSSEERLTVEQSTPPAARKTLEVGIHQTFEVTQSSADGDYGEGSQGSHRVREHV